MSLIVYIYYGCIEIFLISDISLDRKSGCYGEKFVSSVSIMATAIVFGVSILCQFCVKVCQEIFQRACFLVCQF